jgi:hypothetical protein
MTQTKIILQTMGLIKEFFGIFVSNIVLIILILKSDAFMRSGYPQVYPLGILWDG